MLLLPGNCPALFMPLGAFFCRTSVTSGEFRQERFAVKESHPNQGKNTLRKCSPGAGHFCNFVTPNDATLQRHHGALPLQESMGTEVLQGDFLVFMLSLPEPDGQGGFER